CDKMLPLSCTTNLAASIVEVDLFDHIKHMSLTTIPAFIISFILFVLISPHQSVPLLYINEYQSALATTNLIHWTSWLPLIVLICCTIFKIPAFIALACSSLLGSLLAKIINNLAWSDIWNIWFNGYEASTNFEPVNELLTKGGISSMFFTMTLVIIALGFGGLLFTTGMIPTILEAFKTRLRKVRSIIISTVATAIGINVLIGEQYLSILLTGETYKPVYQQAKL